MPLDPAGMVTEAGPGHKGNAKLSMLSAKSTRGAG